MTSIEFPAVDPPDPVARREAAARHERLTKPAGSLGRLEELGVWIASCQGKCPPRPFTRARVVVFAGDHGVARGGVSAYPPEVTGQMVANFMTGGAAINVLSGVAGATVRVVDMAVDADTPEQVSRHKVRRSSGSIDREDALTEDEARQAVAAGMAIADEEIDGGADLLIAGDMGIGNTTPAAVIVAALTGEEPVAVVGRGTGIDDSAWMRKTAAIRDALRRARKVTGDPLALLRTVGGADLAAMAGFLAQAAVRRTPVVLDGLVVGAAAMVAEDLAPGARHWWVAGHRSVEPAHSFVLGHLGLTPVLDLSMRLGEGSGAAAALPLITMAARILTDMATFGDAGVSERSEDTASTPS
ncbi:nicotinate-nucleotide--dimethylbenzimidazole phosphoribosyltransferase [Kutzneria sp. NPDC051319]|uniref:nicotinate-nucleotide--dimethylbenzimidazole phosphoribosyltransferase n=1 Tax=Kutzneria sp. NPDC051319 TaxID=3155047 RepID=UPI003437B223